MISIPTKVDMLVKSTKRTTVTYVFNVTGRILLLKKNSILKLFLRKINFENFSFTGPDHISIIFSPYKGIQLERWSVLKEKPLLGPMWNDRETYFIYFACASNCSPFSFSLEFIVRFFFKILINDRKFFNVNWFFFLF